MCLVSGPVRGNLARLPSRAFATVDSTIESPRIKRHSKGPRGIVHNFCFPRLSWPWTRTLAVPRFSMWLVSSMCLDEGVRPIPKARFPSDEDNTQNKPCISCRDTQRGRQLRHSCLLRRQERGWTPSIASSKSQPGARLGHRELGGRRRRRPGGGASSGCELLKP